MSLGQLMGDKENKSTKKEEGKTYQAGIRFTPSTHKLLNKIKRHYEGLYEDDPNFKIKNDLSRKPNQDFVISEALDLLAKKLKIEV